MGVERIRLNRNIFVMKQTPPIMPWKTSLVLSRHIADTL